MATERIWVADMFTYQASVKAQGLKPYYIEDGKLMPLLVSRCRNKWGVIYFLTDEELKRAEAMADKIAAMKQLEEKKMALLDELLASTIVHNIINQ